MGDVRGEDPVVLVVTTGDSVQAAIEAAATRSHDCNGTVSIRIDSWHRWV